MRRYTNTAMLSIRAAALLTIAGRIQENELWVNDAFKRKMLDDDITEALTDLANWAGYDLVKREASKVEEAA